jgi:hypothetical protein
MADSTKAIGKWTLGKEGGLSVIQMGILITVSLS